MQQIAGTLYPLPPICKYVLHTFVRTCFNCTFPAQDSTLGTTYLCTRRPLYPSPCKDKLCPLSHCWDIYDYFQIMDCDEETKGTIIAGQYSVHENI